MYECASETCGTKLRRVENSWMLGRKDKERQLRSNIQAQLRENERQQRNKSKKKTVDATIEEREERIERVEDSVQKYAE